MSSRYSFSCCAISALFLALILQTRMQLRTMMSNRPLQPIHMHFGRINLPTQLQQLLFFLCILSRRRRKSSPDLRQQFLSKPQTSKQRHNRSWVQLRSSRHGRGSRGDRRSTTSLRVNNTRLPKRRIDRGRLGLRSPARVKALSPRKGRTNVLRCRMTRSTAAIATRFCRPTPTNVTATAHPISWHRRRATTEPAMHDQRNGRRTIHGMQCFFRQPLPIKREVEGVKRDTRALRNTVQDVFRGGPPHHQRLTSECTNKE